MDEQENATNTISLIYTNQTFQYLPGVHFDDNEDKLSHTQFD